MATSAGFVPLDDIPSGMAPLPQNMRFQNSTARSRFLSSAGSNLGVLVVWVQFIGLLILGALQTWTYYSSTGGMPGWLAGFMVIVICLTNLSVWLSFCYIVVGKSVFYIPIYLLLLALAVAASLGDFITVVHMVDMIVTKSA
jgi:hypothetical protein